MIEQAREVLTSVFGYDRFISLQKDVIEHVLGGKDTLAVMPTGGGKSLCYQIPALLFEGLTLVVSPLISLMRDQVAQLLEFGVSAVVLNSSLSPEVYRDTVNRIRRREIKLLYLAPETLLKPKMLSLLEPLSVSCLAIDEAHCISEWGPDFRPEYRQLAKVRALFPGAVCIALTATATERVRKDIRSSLGFDEGAEFTASFNRENLFLQVVDKEDPFRQVIRFLKGFSGEPGIIYCLTRRQVNDLCAGLQREGFSASPYHAGLSDKERSDHQDRFIRDEVQIIVATIAFGMGIDKSNIRFVIHYDLPKNIEGYYQEIGRAGRDGMRAECLLLFSYGDTRKLKSFIDRKEGLEKRVADLQLGAMVQFAESDSCRRIPLLSYFGETYSSENCHMCDNCVAGEREMRDITIPVQKLLSCIKRTGERFGTEHVIHVLLGSRAKRILDFGHDRLSTYGIGKEHSRTEWRQLARQVLHKGLASQDQEFGGLRLTPKAWEVLKGKEVVLGRLEEDGNKPEENSHRMVSPEGTRPLFEILRRKRKELAESAGVPPYVIFSDKTLSEMAAKVPRTMEDLLRVNGIGKVKLEKYGAVFLDLIRTHGGEPQKPPPGVAFSRY